MQAQQHIHADTHTHLHSLLYLFIMGCDTWRPISSQSAIVFSEFFSL